MAIGLAIVRTRSTKLDEKGGNLMTIVHEGITVEVGQEKLPGGDYCPTFKAQVGTAPYSQAKLCGNTYEQIEAEARRFARLSANVLRTPG